MGRVHYLATVAEYMGLVWDRNSWQVRIIPDTQNRDTKLENGGINVFNRSVRVMPGLGGKDLRGAP
jgi:hypothetical protein